MPHDTKFRKLADGLQRQIDDKLRPMTQNPTPKRNREYTARLIEGRQLERAQRALRALADAVDAGELPTELAVIRSKADVLPLVATEIGSNGYYDVHDKGVYRNQSAIAVRLRQLAGLERPPQVDDTEQKKRAVALEDIEGFWPTPDDVCDDLVELAAVSRYHAVLEPSCGWGSIADAVRRACPDIVQLDCFELRQPLAEIASKYHEVTCCDFTEAPPNPMYDRIIMNPPFERKQDVRHVRRAFDHFLRPGGRLVSILARGAQTRSDRESTEFRQWADGLGGEFTDLPDDSFNRQGQWKRTSVSASVLVIDKPETPPEFELANDPPAAKPRRFVNAERTVQRLLIGGLACLPGQGDLF